MKLARLPTLIAFALAVASGTILFATSQQVQRVEHKLIVLKKEKLKEQDSIHVLRAEWDYLNRPDRLEALATQYLGMKPPEVPAVTADPRAIDAPIVPASGKVHKKPALETQEAVYKAPQSAPQPAPPPAAPDPETRDFQDLIHDLNGHGQ